MSMALLAPPMLLAACAATPEGQEGRSRQRELVVAEAGAGAEVLAVCGPFSAVAGADPAIILPGGGKFIAFVIRPDDTLLIEAPFVIPANPPVVSDGTLVAVGQDGRVLPNATRAPNTILRERARTPWSSSFVAGLWRADSQGGPVGDDRETWSASKTWFSHTVNAEVEINGKVSRFTAACD
ncbi:MAG: hypothetical protein ACK4UQ_11610 [Brevundimonas sp.]